MSLLHFTFSISFLAGWKYSLMPLVDWSFVPSRRMSEKKSWKEGLYLIPVDGQAEVRTKGIKKKSFDSNPCSSSTPLCYSTQSLRGSMCDPLAPSSKQFCTVQQLNQFHNMSLHIAAQTAARPQGRQWSGPAAETRVYLGGKAVDATCS